MPLDLGEIVLLVVHDDLAEGGGGLGEALASGDPDLVLSIPVGPGVVGDDDLVDELEGGPVHVELDGQALFDKDLGLVDAVGQGDAGEGVGNDGVGLHATDGHHVVDPVGAGEGVPGLGHHAGHGDGHRAADLAVKAQGRGPQAGAVDGAGQVAGQGDVGREGRNTYVVLQPDALRVQQCQIEGASHQLGALLHGGKVAVVELGGDVVELVGGRVGLPRREGQAIGGVEVAKVAGRVAADGGGDPAAGVEVGAAGLGVTAEPAGGGFGGGLVVALDGEADVLQDVGDIVANLQPLILGADKAGEDHGLAVVGPLAVGHCGAHGLHLGGDDLDRLVRVIRVLERNGGDGVGQKGGVLGGVVDGHKARSRQPAGDLLGDIVAVDQPVHGLADLVGVEGVEHARLGELGASRGHKGEVVVVAVGGVVLEDVGVKDPGGNVGFGDVVGKDIDVTDLEAGDGGIRVWLFDKDYRVDPGAHPVFGLGNSRDLDDHFLHDCFFLCDDLGHLFFDDLSLAFDDHRLFDRLDDDLGFWCGATRREH